MMCSPFGRLVDVCTLPAVSMWTVVPPSASSTCCNRSFALGCGDNSSPIASDRLAQPVTSRVMRWRAILFMRTLYN